MNPSYCASRLTITSSARIQKKLSFLNQQVFQVPWYDNTPQKDIFSGKLFFADFSQGIDGM